MPNLEEERWLKPTEVAGGARSPAGKSDRTTAGFEGCRAQSNRECLPGDGPEPHVSAVVSLSEAKRTLSLRTGIVKRKIRQIGNAE
jgi:hypothetical protein